ncbi:immunoglobulin superfamily member 1-like isoform X2 [Falco peregrinus]|uniref:immunoglobulin superfamily member 1-like isoform X2 n=1 Tax=Falco peregrinus TaxID=8954 RepID=UPI000FFBD807|nr:immunoglobulin superfamily member 1-like isoform X2 [Falco peregrinus]
MVLPVTQVLAFGAWLVAQSKATSRSPTISVFLKPPGVIPPGGSATICCSCQQDSGNFVLYKNGRELRTLQLHGTRAEFPIFNASHQDAGAYTCHCLGGGTVLARSETLDIMVQEFHLPKPILSVLPGQEVATGTYVIFRCTIVHPSAGCFLYLEGQIEALSLLSKERDHFNLSSVHKGNGGRYSCQCFTRDASFQWSAASKPLDLVVRGEPPPAPSTLCSLPGICCLLGEPEKRVWEKAAAVIGSRQRLAATFRCVWSLPAPQRPFR